jgi:hypothetical protein
MTGPIQIVLATPNRLFRLNEQLDFILTQHDAGIEILPGNGIPSDSTPLGFAARAQSASCFGLLPSIINSRNAAANIIKSIENVDEPRFRLSVPAYQDDGCIVDKLARLLALLRTTGAEVVSPDVAALWPSARTLEANKSQPQGRPDNWPKPSGSGCMFLTPREVLLGVQIWLEKLAFSGLGYLPKHDSVIFLINRRMEIQQPVDSRCTGLYQRFRCNEAVANSDFAAIRGRQVKLRRSEHKNSFSTQFESLA